jgi:hypothetical protein
MLDNNMARRSNRFATETQKCIPRVLLRCMSLSSRVHKNIVAQQCLYGKFMSLQKSKLNVPVFERNYIPANLHSFHMPHIDVALKQENVLYIQ